MTAELDALRLRLTARIIGNSDAKDHLVTCLVAGGHILIESPPGLGKTELAKCLAESVGLSFRRIQCTPDLAPSDILGAAAREDGLPGGFEPGPVFSNILLIDEINRAQPKTQSALLEAMAEGSVTVQGSTHRLPEPFMVLATENPIEYEGTYPLPEAQEDRFLMKTRMGYLSPEEEKEVLKMQSSAAGGPLLSRERLIGLKAEAASVRVPDAVADRIVDLVCATRRRREVLSGASTRSSVLYLRAVKARARLEGRDEASAEDVDLLARPVLRHRLVMNPDARNFGYTSDDLIDDVLRKLGQ